MVEFVEPSVFESTAKEKKNERKARETSRVTLRKLPKTITRHLTACRWKEPVFDTPECKRYVYRRVCPVQGCHYLSGRYVSHSSALKALLGHLRWVHHYG